MLKKQYIMKLPNIIQKTWHFGSNITRIGLTNSLNYNINRSTSFPVLFIPKKCIIENIGMEVNKNQVIASLYNDDTRCEYLFYYPIKGTVINRNKNLIDNLESIYINKSYDNWLVDIEPSYEKEKEKLKTKYHWFY